MVCRQLRPAFRVEESWWTFHALAHPTLRDFTLEDAARADIIILALEAAADPPWMVRAWVDTRANRRIIDEGALVLLLAAPIEENSNPGGVEHYLREAARIARMDVFVNAHPVRLAQQLHARCAPAAKPLRLSESGRHWGINE
jgi:hypothetical protein